MKNASRDDERWPSRTARALYQPYKYLVFAPLFGLATVLFGSLAVLLSFVLPPGLAGRLTGVVWGRLVALITPVRVRVEGRRNVRPGQSYVVVCNHRSQFDILVLYGWLGVDFRWVMKQELRRVPVLGVACARLGHIFIDRSQRARALASIEAAKARIAGGTSVLFFPEGTRSSDGSLLRFKTGAFRFALDLGLPVLPVTIVGTRRILPPATLDMKPGRARLVLHPPIPVEGRDPEDFQSLLEEARAAIASAM